MSKTRGFEKLVDITISKVETDCVNQVVLYDDQYKFTIDVEVKDGIPVLKCSRHKIKKPKIVPTAVWPYPPEK